MKINFLKKIMLFFGLAVGAVTISACQSTSIVVNKTVSVKTVSTEILYNETTKKSYALMTFEIVNNTIYDISSWDYTIQGTYMEGGETKTSEEQISDHPFFVRHGVGGNIVTSNEIADNVTDVACKDFKPHTVLNAWQTYLGWWVVGIVIAAISWIFFTIEIISKKLTSGEIMMAFKRNVATSISMGFVIILLCLFPLFFGNWVPTIILIVSIASSILGCGAITAIASLVKK